MLDKHKFVLAIMPYTLFLLIWPSYLQATLSLIYEKLHFQDNVIHKDTCMTIQAKSIANLQDIARAIDPIV